MSNIHTHNKTYTITQIQIFPFTILVGVESICYKIGLNLISSIDFCPHEFITTKKNFI